MTVIASPDQRHVTSDSHGPGALVDPLPAADQHACEAQPLPVSGGNHLASDHHRSDAQTRRVAGNPLPADHCTVDSHSCHVGGNPLAEDQASRDALTTAVLGNPLAPDQTWIEAQRPRVGGTPLPADHHPIDAHARYVGGNHLAPDQICFDALTPHVGGNQLEPQTIDPAKPNVATSAAPQSFALDLAAAALDDIESLRKATNLRIKAKERDGLGDLPEVHASRLMLEMLEKVEHQAILDLQRSMRRHPLGQWVKRTVGVGEKQGARLIAAIGDIDWNHAEDRPRRGPAELWAYCGYAPGQKRRKGVVSNWNADAKMRAHLIAEAAIKSGIRKNDGCDDASGYDAAGRIAITTYGATYLTARTSWQDHDTSDMHKHNHALRLVAKAVLRDMFAEARRIRNGVAA